MPDVAVTTAAHVLRSFLRELPEPLIPFDCYADIVAAGTFFSTLLGFISLLRFLVLLFAPLAFRLFNVCVFLIVIGRSMR